MASTVRIDGLPVAAGTAVAFGRLKAAFERRFPGISLHVYSGYRSDADQARIFLERYRPQVSGVGPYGDVRWWNGVRYVRYSGEGTVAQPGTSNHRSGHAIDIRDSGADAGVTVAGNARSNWIRTNAYVYGFNPAGYGFAEPWHVEYVGDPWFSPGAPANVPESNESEEDDMTPEQERKLNEIHDALFKDGKAPKDWSVQHKIDWLRRQFADASIDSPGGPQKRWSLPHILSWMGRVLNDLGARTKRIETKLGITEKRDGIGQDVGRS